MEPMPPRCRVPKVQNGGERDPAVILFVDDAISMKFQLRKDDARVTGGCDFTGDVRKRIRGGTPIADEEDDGVVDSSGDRVETDNVALESTQRKLEDL